MKHALLTFLICFNGKLYSTTSFVNYSKEYKIIEISNAIDLKTKCNDGGLLSDGFEDNQLKLLGEIDL